MVSAMAADRFFWVSSCALAGAARSQAATTAAAATRFDSADMGDLPVVRCDLPAGRPATLRRCPAATTAVSPAIPASGGGGRSERRGLGLADRQVQPGGEQAERDVRPPHQVVVAGRLED